MAVIAEHYKERYIYPYTNNSENEIPSGTILLAGDQNAGGTSYVFPAFVLHNIKAGETESVARYGQWTIVDTNCSETFQDGQPIFGTFNAETGIIESIGSTGTYFIGQCVGGSYTAKGYAAGLGVHVAVFPDVNAAVVGQQVRAIGSDETVTDIASLKAKLAAIVC